MDINRKTLIVIVGATGCGKTDLSIEVAEHYCAPIISTDSRQLYKGMPIGTAQPTPEQLSRVKHHMIATHSISEHYTCGRYESDALSILGDLFNEHTVVVAVGGSGLYIDALCNGIDFMPATDFALRQTLVDELESKGLEPLLSRLKELDPAYYEVVERSNPQRVLRALEVSINGGKPYSSYREGCRVKRDFNIIKVAINMDRKILYDRINMRVDLMMSEGLEAEARELYPSRALNSLQTVGYRELFEYFDGNCTLSDAVDLIKRNSRRYAKRQITWFKRDLSTIWINYDKLDSIYDIIDNQTDIEK